MALFRTEVRTLSPASLQNGTGERYMYDLGLHTDALMQKMVEGGGTSRFPTLCDPSFLPIIGQDRLIGQGLTEPTGSYRVRLQKAFEAWQLAGSARSVLGQALAYLLAFTPQARMVSSRFSGNVADLLFVTDASNETPIRITTKRGHGLKTGDTVDVEGVGGNTAANGTGQTVTVDDENPRYTFTLDGSVGSGSYTAGGYVVPPGFPTIYPPNLLSSIWDTYAAGANTLQPPQHVFRKVGGIGANWDWDTLSPVDGSWLWQDSYAIFYAVSPNEWTTPATWAIGDPGLTIGTLPGSIGLSVVSLVIQSLRVVVGQWKAAHALVRWIIVSFDAALFDPNVPAGGGINPDGYFGRWSKIDGGAYVPARFADARYCDGIL